MSRRRALIGLALAAALGLALAAVLAGCGSTRAKHDPPDTPVRFIPQSASFVTVSLGWAWGPGRWPAAGAPTAGVLSRTTDGGRHWTVVQTPSITYGQRGVTGVRFLSRLRGYLFGPRLLATADGGANWTQLHPPGAVLDLETGGGEAYALAAECPSCSTARLYRVGPALTGIGPRTPVNMRWWSLVARGRSVYLLTPQGRDLGSSLWISHDRGRSWRRSRGQCQWSGALTSWSPSDLALACGSQPSAGNQAKVFYASTDGGASWRRVGRIRFGPGYVAALAAANANTWLLGEARGRIEITHDGGHRWRPVKLGPASAVEGWGQVVFINRRRGFAVPWTLNGDVLAFTADGGRAWREVAFRK